MHLFIMESHTTLEVTVEITLLTLRWQVKDHLKVKIIFKYLLIGLVGVPSQFACIFGAKYFGRKKLTIFFVLLIFISSLLMIPPSVRMYGGLFGIFSVCSSYAIIYLLKREVYPTILRSTADGATKLVSRIGALVAPFIKQIVINSIDFKLI